MATDRVVKTTKRLAAERQIHAAIKHFQTGDFECAITLCSAAEGQMPEPPDPIHLVAILKQAGEAHPAPDGERDDWNYAANWMKHGWGAAKVEIKEWVVAWWLGRAISKYCSVYGIGTPEMAGLFPLTVAGQPTESITPSRIAPER